MVARDQNFLSLLAQMQKKDDQIERLSESVFCMEKEIQKLNSVIFKLQEQVVKSYENTSTTSKGVLQVPLSKVQQPGEKRTAKLRIKHPSARCHVMSLKKP